MAQSMMQKFRWSTVLLAASLIPSFGLVAFMLLYMLVYRPSGAEAWGDAAAIAHFGVTTYPVAVAPLIAGTAVAVLGRDEKSRGAADPLLFAVSVVLLMAPWGLLAMAIAFGPCGHCGP